MIRTAPARPARHARSLSSRREGAPSSEPLVHLFWGREFSPFLFALRTILIGQFSNASSAFAQVTNPPINPLRESPCDVRGHRGQQNFPPLRLWQQPQSRKAKVLLEL